MIDTTKTPRRRAIKALVEAETIAALDRTTALGQVSLAEFVGEALRRALEDERSVWKAIWSAKKLNEAASERYAHLRSAELK